VAHVQLHLHSLQHPSSSPSNEQLKALLKSLPASMQSRPAVVATLEVLGEADDDSKGVSSSSKTATTTRGSPAEKADKLFRQGQYKEAADLYKEDRPSSSSNIAQQLRRVQALAMSDQHDEATKLWASLQPHLEKNDGASTTTTTMDGEALEQQALPRSSTAKMDKQLIDSSSNKQPSTKRSPDGVLRQRARKREDYLNRLAGKGDYNPDRPSKPNPERWIPKHERSRARRRGQNNANRSAQGGGYTSQADVQRLDAAARRAGTLPTSAAASTPSTANLKVASANGGARKGGRRR
jgi:signal recognition particle subunit SRP72